MVRVASVGECMIELRHKSDTELDLAFGGDTLNFAVYLARLTRGRDVAVDYVTALGDDTYSAQMLASWQAESLGVEQVARLPGRLPGLYTIRTDAKGERSFTYWRSTSAARDMLKDGRAERLAGALAGCDLLYFSGITLAILDEGQRAALLDLAVGVRARGGRVAFDTNYRPTGWPDVDTARDAFAEAGRRADIAMPTLDDDLRLFGIGDAAGSAAYWHGLGVAEVVVKLGPGGCHLSSPAFTGPVPAEPVARVVDSTAAGDSLDAGYLAARLLGAGPEAAAKLGNRLAARVISHRGAIIPAEVMTDLSAG